VGSRGDCDSCIWTADGFERLAEAETNYWLRVSLTPRIRARVAEMADFIGYRLNGPKDVLSPHRHGGL